MGAKYKEAGGGPTVGLANDFTNWLGGGLNSGTFGNYANYSGSGRPRPQGTGATALYNSNPVGSTTGISGVINDALAGNLGGDQSWGVDTGGLTGLMGTGAYNFDPLNVGQVGGYQTMMDDPLFGAVGDQLFGMMTIKPEDMQAMISGVAGAGGGVPGYEKVAAFDIGNVDISPYQALWDRRRDQGLADARARFGAAGGASFGTPAAFAESNYLNENAAQEAATMAEIGRAQQALELQRQLAAEEQNTSRYGSYAGASAQLGAASKAAAASAFGDILRNQLGAGNALLSGLGTGYNQGLVGRGQDIDYNLGVGGLQNQWQNMVANNQLGAAGLDADIMRAALGLDLQGQGLQQNWDQFQAANQLSASNYLTNLMAQLSGKGIAQREGFMQPSTFQNVMGAVSGIAGAAAPFFGPGAILGKGLGAATAAIGAPSAPALSPLTGQTFGQQFQPTPQLPTGYNYGGFGPPPQQYNPFYFPRD